VKSRWRPRSGCDGRIITKFLITKIQANLCASDNSYRPDFFTVQCCFIPRRVFLLTAVAPMLACIKVLPKLAFVLLCVPFLSPLPHRWWYGTCIIALAQNLGECRGSGGAFYTILCLECCLLCSKWFVTKCNNTSWPGDTSTFHWWGM